MSKRSIMRILGTEGGGSCLIHWRSLVAQKHQSSTFCLQGIDILDKTTMTQAGGIGIESFHGRVLGLDLLVFGTLTAGCSSGKGQRAVQASKFHISTRCLRIQRFLAVIHGSQLR